MRGAALPARQVADKPVHNHLCRPAQVDSTGLWDETTMDTLREAIAQDGPLVLALGGLVIGFLFGAVVFATNFCAMGSLSRHP